MLKAGMMVTEGHSEEEKMVITGPPHLVSHHSSHSFQLVRVGRRRREAKASKSKITAGLNVLPAVTFEKVSLYGVYLL